MSTVLNNELKDFFISDPLKYLFPLHVLDKKPLEVSTVIIDEGHIRAASVNGLMYGHFEVFSHWIKAESEEPFIDMLKLLKGEEIYINCDDCFYDLLSKSRNVSELSLDRYYTRSPQGTLATGHGDLDFVRLDEKSLPEMILSEEMKNQIGSFKDFPEGSSFWGLLRGRELVAIADALVSFEEYASISQVYTLKSERGMGLGREMVARVSNCLFSLGKTVSYLVNEANLPSIKLVESLGYELKTKFCFAKITG